jgi:hypothetical protein
MRSDACRTIAAQLLRATDVGGAEFFNASSINDAVRAWEKRRGLKTAESWFEQHRKKERNPPRDKTQETDVKRRRGEEQTALVLSNPESYTRACVARHRIAHARRIGGLAAARAEQRTLRAESNARAEAKRQERVLAEAAARLANIDSLNAMSRARTLIEEAKRTGGPAAEAAMRAQIRDERRARKAAEQRERRAREKKVKAGK